MGIERLGLLFLLRYFNHLGEVKDHLLTALREVVLAINSTLDIIVETAKDSSLGPHVDKIDPLIEKVNDLIEYSLEKITPADKGLSRLSQKEAFLLKETLVQSIVNALDEEIDQVQNPHTKEGKIRIEALATVKQVLRGQVKIEKQPKGSVKIA